MFSKVYTKTGDKGETSLFGGQRVPKDDPRVEAYGALDEADASIGLARALSSNEDVKRALKDAQKSLHLLEAELASPNREFEADALVDEGDVGELEGAIDRFSGELEPLNSFIIPGDDAASAAIHVARTVTRRAERRIASLAKEEGSNVRPEVLSYVNRLSDLLFVLSRVESELK